MLFSEDEEPLKVNGNATIIINIIVVVVVVYRFISCLLLDEHEWIKVVNNDIKNSKLWVSAR